MQNFRYRALRWLVFKIGDIRQKNVSLAWNKVEPEIDFNACERALDLLEPGDVILHRDDGFLSNLFIGGKYIHAGIYVGGHQVVEAIAEGVVKRHVFHILHSDHAIILRPRVSPVAKGEAVRWANAIVGNEYDVQFDFNAEEERKIIAAGGKSPFCCTEIVFFTYLNYTKELGIARQKSVGFLTRLLEWFGLHPGREIVSADMYAAASGFDKVWEL